MSLIADFAAGLAMAAGHRGRARRVVEFVAPTRNDRVLDIGCGPGNAVRAAGDRTGEVIGVDPSPAMLRIARWLTMRRKARAKIRYEPGAAESLPLADGSVTVAWAIASFHHWADPPAGLKEARRVLAKGGRLFLVERLVGHGRARQQRHGLTASRADSVAIGLRDAGFAEVSTETVADGRGRYVVVRGVA
jgi:ubiquinone/menaquinone biosynthesis C-methylase UbiE